MVFYLAVVAAMTIGAVLVWRQRAEIGLKQAYDLVQAGLPNETELVQAAATRFRQRQAATTIGSWLGGAVALLALGTLGEPLIVLVWCAMSGLFGVAAAVCVLHYRTVRATRPQGPRLASLGQRRLRDYLVWPEIACQYVAVVLPLATAGVGIVVLTTADDPRTGWTLIGIALGCLLVCVAGTILQRKVLALPQPASGESELRWEEALRAATLRDLSELMVWVCWLLGGAAVITVDLPSGLPAFVEPLSYVLFGGGIAVLAVTTLSSAGKWGLRRSQRALG
jgi:hypothetical protein